MLIEVDFRALGLEISKYRHQANLSQEKLAERIGLSKNFIGNIERGVSKLSVKTLLNISYALNLPLNDLLDPTISRVIDEHNEHSLRDSALGYANTLTALLLTEEIIDEDIECIEEGASFYGILDIDDQYFEK